MAAVRVMSLPSVRVRRPVEVLPPVERSTERLLFRPLAMSDRAQVLDAVRCSRETLEGRVPLNREGPGPRESDAAMFERWAHRAAVDDRDRTGWRRAAFLGTGVFVGVFSLIKIERGLEWSCEATWWVDRRFTGRGYATEGAEALLAHALDDLPVGLGLSRVRAVIQPTNAASLRVAEKIGLRPTGEREVLPVGGRERVHLVFERLAG